MAVNPLVFRIHALKRMFERGISDDNIRYVLFIGEVIESYPYDNPFPSRLILGWCGQRPVHVVVADNAAARETIVITVYEPDPTIWEPGFKRRIL